MKWLSNFLITIIIFSFTNFIDNNFDNYEFPIFMYHSISDEIIGESSATNLEVKNFEEQMKYIHDNNIKTIFLDELDNYKNSDERIIILTFDDGYKNFYEVAYPIMKKYKIKSNLFMITNYVDERYTNYLSEKQLIELDSSPYVKIGSHTKTHPRLAKINKKKAYNELNDSKLYLEKILNRKVTMLSYPYGNYNYEIAKYTKSIGYEYITLVNGGIENRDYNKYQLKRINVPRKMDLETYKSYINNHTKNPNINR